MTLHDRIRAVVEERLRIAREATPGPWQFEETDRFDEETIGGTVHAPPLIWPIVTEFAGKPADAAHVIANDPADAILSAEHSLDVLERHAIVHRNINWLELDDGELCEETAEIPVCGRCVPKHSGFRSRAEVPEGPCIEVRELATRWRVEVDG